MRKFASVYRIRHRYVQGNRRAITPLSD